jgi:hypothetical protein
VLVDELGKGTEVLGGSALAAAMLEELVARGCSGVFASHLHLLQSLPLDTPGLVKWRMEVAEDEGWGRRAGSDDDDEEVEEGAEGGVERPYPLAGEGVDVVADAVLRHPPPPGGLGRKGRPQGTAPYAAGLTGFLCSSSFFVGKA